LPTGADSDLDSRIALTNSLALLIAVAVSLAGVSGYVRGEALVPQIDAFWVFSVLLVLFANQFRFYTFSRAWFLISVNVPGLIMCWLQGKESQIHRGYLLMVAIPLMIFSAREKIWIFSGALLTVICFLLADNLPASFSVPGNFPVPTLASNVFSGGLALSLAFLINYYFFRTAERMKAAQLQTEKLASVGTLAGGFAHEINNPLAIIMFRASLAADAKEDPERVAQQSRAIQDAAKRIKRIVDHLLVIGKKERLEAKTRIELNQVVHESFQLASACLSDAGVQVQLALSTPSPVIQGNATQLISVFQNLISNSLDAFEGRTDEEPRKILVQEERRGRRVILSFSDNAGGIPSHLIPRIFEPFFTTKEVGKGTGLGLSIVQGIVESHGGTIAVTNSPGQGASFRLEFSSV
jgi:signal transduction histidine kinase